MNDYRIIKTWDNRYTLQAWSVYNFDGIPDHIWKDRQTFDTLGQAFDNLFLARGEAIPEDYFEITHGDNGEEITNFFSDFEQATEYADTHQVNLICEVGASFDEYAKCEWCGEWYDLYTIDENNGICDQCYAAIRSRGERW